MVNETPFEFRFNDLTLRGRIAGPDDPAVPLVIVCHGFLLSKNSAVPKTAFEFFVENGYRVIRFDFPGLGESDGQFRDMTISRNAASISALMNELAGKGAASKQNTFLCGHSMGAAACAYAARQGGFKGLVLFSTPLDWMAQKNFNDPHFVEEWKRTGTAKVFAERKKTFLDLDYGYYEDAVGKKVAQHLKESQTPAFLVQAQLDCVLPQQALAKLLAASAPGSLGLLISNSDHSFQDGKLQPTLEQALAWMRGRG